MNIKTTIFFCTILTAIFIMGCSKSKPVDDNPRDVIAVSILPQKFITDSITKNQLETFVLVGPGASPATYEPTPAQMQKISESKVLFTIGVPFENSLLPRLKSNFPELEQVDCTKGLILREMLAHQHDEHEHSEECEHNEGGTKDPHVWLNPLNMIIMANNITSQLCKMYPEKTEEFEKNLEELKQKLTLADIEIKNKLSDLDGRKIFVFHPSFGYFAQRYGLEQVAIESQGKSPGPKQLAEIIKHAKEENAKVIFVQKQFSTDAAKAIADSVGAAVVQIDPLSEDYISNLYIIANSIKQELSK